MPFSTIKSLVVNYEDWLQRCLESIPSSKDVYVGGSMFVCMNYNIKSVLTAIQNRDRWFPHPQYMQAGAKLSKMDRLLAQIATKPPSSASECPVTNEDASEQSQTTASAISSARPSRPIGIARVIIEDMMGLPAMAPCTMAVSV